MTRADDAPHPFRRSAAARLQFSAMVKQTVNRALARVTGYQLQRAQGDPRVARPEAGLERAHTQLARTKRALTATRKRLAAAEAEASRARRATRRAKAIPRFYDEAAVEIIQRVQDRTMTDHAKLFGLVEATRYVARSGIPGDVVECGVWRGGSMQAVALTLLEQGASDRGLHLFDTFEGMPPPTEADRRGDTSAEEMLAAHSSDHRVWAVAGLDDVREAMREVDYPEQNVYFHEGLVEDTVPGQAPEVIALLRLDTDWYESTRHELEHLYDRLAPGGVLILDDYGDWDGARKAADEFVAGLGHPLLLQPLGSGRLVVKPPR